MKKILTGRIILIGVVIAAGCSAGLQATDLTGSWWLSKIAGTSMGMTNTNFITKAQSPYLLELNGGGGASATLKMFVIGPSSTMYLSIPYTMGWKIDKSYLIYTNVVLWPVAINVSNSITNYTYETNSVNNISVSTLNPTNSVSMSGGKLRFGLSQSDTNQYMEFTK